MTRPLASLALLALLLPQTARAEPWRWADKGDGAVTVLLMADTNIQNRADPASAYRHVLDTLKAADIRFANLEGPFAGSSKNPRAPDIPHKEDWSHSEPDQVAGLAAAGIDGVGVANNVTFPWTALMSSLAVLDKAGIGHTGGGANLAEAHRPLIIEREGTRIAFLQYAATVAPYDHAATADRPGVAEIKVHTAYRPPRNIDKPGQPPIVVTTPDPDSLKLMTDGITAAKAQADVVVASYHWGISNVTEPVDYQRALSRAAIDAGADIVFGHGPHKFQPVEIYRGKPVILSAANFVFDWPKARKTPEGLLVRAVVRNRKLASVSLVPVWRDTANDVWIEDPGRGKGKELFEQLREITGPAGAKLTLVGKEIRIEGIE